MNLNNLDLPTVEFCPFLIVFIFDYFLNIIIMTCERGILPYAVSYGCPPRERVNSYRKKVSDNYFQVLVQFCGILLSSNKHTKCYISQSFQGQPIQETFYSKVIITKTRTQVKFMFLFQGGTKVFFFKCIIHCLPKINHNSRSQRKQPVSIVWNFLADKTVRSLYFNFITLINLLQLPFYGSAPK